MAAINDLVAQIKDEALRRQIEAELKRVMKHKKFGLVFEDHLPEGLNDGPIYPGLEVVDSVRHAKDDQLWHALIQADNYYALQLLAYLYPASVDCIYIDPPYNTGAKDWKYNNDYVDTSDTYRHSKWLSMMKRRLLLAKRLLNPKDSVLIVTIDEKEYLHLGCLLEELFPEAKMQMVSIVHNPGGAIRVDALNRVNEYAFYLFIGEAKPSKSTIAFLPSESSEKKKDANRSPIWRGLLRGGANPLRQDSPLKFYPILVDKDGRVVGAGEPLPLNKRKEDYVVLEGLTACWPIKQEGVEGRWELKLSTFEERLAQGYVKAGEVRKDGSRSIYYLRNAEIERLEKGELISSGMTELGYLDIQYNEKIDRSTFPKTVWNNPRHNATEYGSNLIKSIIGKDRFSYPKSLYAVADSISFIVANKPNALIVDFFAGSGTTLHAVNLLNAEDGGHRRCIMVTNNEVSVEEAKTLTKQGYKPGDEEWEKLGIARYVNWPRTVCSIEGHDVNGLPLKGEYLGTDHRPMSEGFDANCILTKTEKG